MPGGARPTRHIHGQGGQLFLFCTRCRMVFGPLGQWSRACRADGCAAPAEELRKATPAERDAMRAAL